MEDGYESSSSRRRRARAQAMPGAGEPSLSKSLEAKIPFQMREQQLALLAQTSDRRERDT